MLLELVLDRGPDDCPGAPDAGAAAPGAEEGAGAGVIWRIVLAGLIGYFQVAAICVQTRLLAAGRTGWPVFWTSVLISSIWTAGVLSVVSRPVVAISYVFCAALGAVSASRFPLFAGPRPKRHLLPRSLRRP